MPGGYSPARNSPFFSIFFYILFIYLFFPFFYYLFFGAEKRASDGGVMTLSFA
jgi:hypothetical protein